jgi:hypothetical protein
MNDTDARLWHPWLRIDRVLRVMLYTRWSAGDADPKCLNATPCSGRDARPSQELLLSSARIFDRRFSARYVLATRNMALSLVWVRRRFEC